MSSIKVAVRCRPLFEGERPATGLDVQQRRILLDNKTYDPDYTFTAAAQQDEVFQICKPVLDAVKEGGLNGTIMVYGQTGTGKTYTMLGNEGQDNGLVHKVIGSMLDHVQSKCASGSECALTLSMIEIYNEKLTDMLSPHGNDEVVLIGGFPRFTHKVTLCTLEDANQAVARGLAWRHTAATMMNERSSRSHVVFIVDYEEVNAYTNETEVSHLFLVDLAGSESLKKSQAVGATAGEAGKINKSLLALKGVFLALSNTNEANRPSHVPYRDSRLTELLQDSVGGTARTLMIACISSVGRDLEETKSTLMYAVKARSIRNATNSEREKLLIKLRSLEVENQRLRNRLEDRVAERGGYTIGREEHQHYQQLEEEVQQLRTSVAQMVKESQAVNARQHISESRAKVLENVIEEKEKEIQQYKLIYQDALRKFELQSRHLQRTVQLTVGMVQNTAQELATRQYTQLDSWRKSVEEAADQSPEFNLAATMVSSSTGVVSPQRTPRRRRGGVLLPATDAEAPPTLEEPNGEVLVSANGSQPQHGAKGVKSPLPVRSHGAKASRRGAVSPAALSVMNSPSRVSHRASNPPTTAAPSSAGRAIRSLFSEEKTRRGPEELEMGEEEEVAALPPCGADNPLALLAHKEEEVETGIVEGVVASLATPSEALRESDEACHRILERIYGAFHHILSSLSREKQSFQERLHRLEEQRHQQLLSFTERLTQTVSESVRQMQHQEHNAAREMSRLEKDFESHWRVAVGPSSKQTTEPQNHNNNGKSAEVVAVPTAEFLSLQHVSRNLCRSVCRSAQEVFPVGPEVPPAMTGALQHIVLQYEQQLSQSVGQQLAPLASVPPAVLCASELTAQATPRASGTSTASSAGSGSSALLPQGAAGTSAGGRGGGGLSVRHSEATARPSANPSSTPLLPQGGPLPRGVTGNASARRGGRAAAAPRERERESARRTAEPANSHSTTTSTTARGGVGGSLRRVSSPNSTSLGTAVGMKRHRSAVEGCGENRSRARRESSPTPSRGEAVEAAPSGTNRRQRSPAPR